jgi:chromatin remodeling complex protein RSC6
MADAPSSTKPKRQPSAAFMKPVQPDDQLGAIVGNEPISRTEITRRIWEYIRRNNLQDPENRTLIKADDQLKQVFNGKDRVTMFEMTKLVFTHAK